MKSKIRLAGVVADQFSLPFDETARMARTVRRRHRLHKATEASSLAYEKIKKGRSKLYRPILELLQPEKEMLTAREILRRLKDSGQLPETAERNNVSPRLTELLEAGCIENPLCSDGSSVLLQKLPGEAVASTWRITAKGRELLQFWQSEIKPGADI